MGAAMIFRILTGYFALLGLLFAGTLLKEAFSRPKAPGGVLLLLLPEDPEKTEGVLFWYDRKLSRDPALAGHFAVVLPENPEAAAIAERYCKDRGLPLADCSVSPKVL